MRAAIGLLGALIGSGCGNGAAGSDGGAGDAATVDAGPGADAAPAADAGPSCGVTWQLVPTRVTNLALLDPAPLNGERPVRILVTTTLSGCDDRAMMSVGFTLEGQNAIIEPRAWRPVGADCADPERSVDRPITIELYQGTWQVFSGTEGSTADPLTITVAAAPGGACGGDGACMRDCDCQDGERCLGGNGFAGPFTACARPCELDRDCGGNGTCISAADGLDFHCDSGVDECDEARPCPVGFSCAAGSCEPDFQLNQGTRGTCACDADCTPGLRCVEPILPDGERRCEVACRTDGPWCAGAHTCGWAGEDLSGLAEQNSVCIWLGE